MELVRFSHDGKVAIGQRQNGHLLPLDSTSLVDALNGHGKSAGAPIPRSEVDVLPALDANAKILCVALNYVNHAVEAKQPVPESPILFFKSQEAMIAADQQIVAPLIVRQLDYEGEIAIVIGKEAWNVAEEDAWDYVAGLTPFNDVSSRDLLNVKAGEKVHLDWFSAKCLNSSTPMGPGVVQTADIIDDLKAKRTRVVTRVNGEVRQDAEIKDMIFDIPKIVAFASSRVKLSPGDVIATGTPPGVGFATGQFLSKGDVVEVEITGLPLLRNVVG
jgi:2-keto-4-pentenoate hydratase/2-oxohepta-3-ene-1,7-dioic acid hydratase in catechol pathway